MARAEVIDLRPTPVLCRGYQGDPFDWSIDLTVNGQPADLDGWSWEAWIDLDGGLVVPWICTPEPHGVALYLRGADTARLPASYCPFDVTGRDPDAGEGRTFVRGSILCGERITPPLRAHASLGVTPHPLVPA
jgi:hypothetical protein